MSNVNLNLYKIFCKVVESKSLSDASEKLDVSVPNISTQISNLENQLGLKLFNREPKGLKITEDGKELYEIVSKSISSFDFAEKMAQDKNNIETGNITIGCPSHFTTYFLMDKIEKVKRQYPKINIKVVCEADTNKMLELLQEHKMDFAIIDSDLDRINVVVEEILKIENTTERSIEYMLYGMRSQLFWDGNKRTSIICANKIMIEKGCGIIKIPDNKLKEFMELLSNYYTTGEKEEIKEFIYNYCIDGLIIKE